MKKNVEILKKCPLFAGINENDIQALLQCLNVKEHSVKKGEFIFSAGDEPLFVGIVLSGSIHVIQENYWGDRTILSAVFAGGLFAEAFSCAQSDVLPVSVIAVEKSNVLLIDCRRILTSCSSACVFHAGLIQNLLKILADQNIMMTRKMEHITRKTTQEKVLSYLSECAVSAGSNSFEIPFDRQALADYLAVERSALSSVLSRMRNDGVLEFQKNRFTLLE